MDKLKLAHDYLLKIMSNSPLVDQTDIEFAVATAWKYADAMQAEADERNKAEAEQKRKEIREMLNATNTLVEREGQHFDDVEEWQPDWSQAPENAVAFLKLSDWDIPAWIDEHGIQIEDAPSFGYTGTHIVERPHGF